MLDNLSSCPEHAALKGCSAVCLWVCEAWGMANLRVGLRTRAVDGLGTSIAPSLLCAAAGPLGNAGGLFIARSLALALVRACKDD